jgi:hypothetical protein
MLDLTNVIRNEGNNLNIAFPILDINGVFVNAGAPQGFQTNIQRLSDLNWWNSGTNAFDLGAEPGLITGSEIGSTGIYEYILVNGFNGTSFDYIVRLKGITGITFDIYAPCRLMLDLAGTQLGVDAALDAANTLLASPANADTGSLRDWIQTMVNLMKGKKLETSTLQSVRNEADGADFATRSIADAAGTLTVGKAT